MVQSLVQERCVSTSFYLQSCAHFNPGNTFLLWGDVFVNTSTLLDGLRDYCDEATGYDGEPVSPPTWEDLEDSRSRLAGDPEASKIQQILNERKCGITSDMKFYHRKEWDCDALGLPIGWRPMGHPRSCCGSR